MVEVVEVEVEVEVVEVVEVEVEVEADEEVRLLERNFWTSKRGEVGCLLSLLKLWRAVVAMGRLGTKLAELLV